MKLFLFKRYKLKLSEIHKMIKNHGISYWFPGPKNTSKIAIFHIFVSSGGNFLYQKAHETFHFNFLVEFQLYFIGFMQVYVKVILLKKYLRSKFLKVLDGFFFEFYEAPDIRKNTFTI